MAFSVRARASGVAGVGVEIAPIDQPPGEKSDGSPKMRIAQSGVIFFS